MTIRTGESYVVETLTQFKNRLHVNTNEIIDALRPELKQRIVKNQNEVREIEGKDPITTEEIKQIHEDDLKEELSQIATYKIIIDVLEARDREYTHLYDSVVHRIIELH